MSEITRRVKSILMSPKKSWLEIKNEEISTFNLFSSYVLILSAIPCVARFIGAVVSGKSAELAFGYAMFIYISSLFSLLIVAYSVNVVAKRYASKTNFNSALKLIVFSQIPAWVGGAFFVIPSLAIVGMLVSFYSLYILANGLPVMMETPEKKVAGYLIIAIIANIAVFSVVHYYAAKRYPSISGGIKQSVERVKDVDITDLIKKPTE